MDCITCGGKTFLYSAEGIRCIRCFKGDWAKACICGQPSDLQFHPSYCRVIVELLERIQGLEKTISDLRCHVDLPDA